MLYREPMWLKYMCPSPPPWSNEDVSVLYREPMWLKLLLLPSVTPPDLVSVLYREPMWLKWGCWAPCRTSPARFSALP